MRVRLRQNKNAKHRGIAVIAAFGSIHLFPYTKTYRTLAIKGCSDASPGYKNAFPTQHVSQPSNKLRGQVKNAKYSWNYHPA